MDAVDGFCRLADWLTKEDQQKNWLRRAFQEGYPVAIYAYGVFARPGTVREDGTMKTTDQSKLLKRDWLYVDPDALLGLSLNDEVEVGMYKSSPDSDLDVWATWKQNKKIQLRRDNLWFPQELCESVTEMTDKNNVLSEREKQTLLKIIAALCHAMNIDPKMQGVAKKVAGMTVDIGHGIGYETVLKKLKECPSPISAKSN